MIHLFIFLYLTPQPIPPHVQKEGEICRGATYFIVHGHSAPWVKHKKLLCRIGKHDFYGDIK